MGRKRRKRDASSDVFALVVVLSFLALLSPSVRDALMNSAIGIAAIAVVGGFLYALVRRWRNLEATRDHLQMRAANPASTRATEGAADAITSTEVEQPQPVGSELPDGPPMRVPVTAARRSPYVARKTFFNWSEAAFYGALRSAVAERYVVFAKVRLLDVCDDLDRNESAAFNRISQKHIDFLLCDPMTFRPAAAIELDGSSHWRRDRIDRDSFVDELFEGIGVPLIRFRVGRNFEPTELWQRISRAVGG